MRQRAATTPERVWRELQLRRRFANWLAAHPLRANGLLDDHHARWISQRRTTCAADLP